MEALLNNSFKIRQLIPKDFCLKCSGCCRFSQQDSIWSPCLLNSEIKKLCQKNFPPSLFSTDKRLRLEPSQKGNSFLCPLLNTRNNKCKIYSFRPLECQLYPFLINRNGNSIFLAVDLKCPFAKENLSQEKFREYTRFLTDALNSPQGLDTLRNNLHLIQIYNEILNLSELKI